MTLKIHLAQINSSVGDLSGNCQKILAEYKKAQDCDLVVFSEMAICGYPACDLWLKESFIDEVEDKLLDIIEATQDSRCAILLGTPLRSKKDLHNSALLIEDGKIIKICSKKSLVNYGVFDEKRYFKPANSLSIIDFRDMRLAILICEDLWDAKNLFLLKEQIFDAVISVNSSPYRTNKKQDRLQIARKVIGDLNKPLIYVNQVGAQDSLVFDGASFVLANNGDMVTSLQSFAEDNAVVQLAKEGAVVALAEDKKEEISDLESHYNACILGLRDYVQKSGFDKVLIGLSGGIDSALVATIAVDALGSKNVDLYALPSRYNSEESMVDAQECAQNLSVNLQVIAIEDSFKALLGTLNDSQGDLKNIVEENLQSRIRGNILMALSNNSGSLLLSTGNKSELACGYATLYGDMCGAFNPLKDIYKSEVFELSKWRNNNVPTLSLEKLKAPIVQNIIQKPPSAELRFDQKDSDSLPDYDILDKILFSLIEEQKSVAQIIEAGFNEEIVKKVAKLFYASEYKRNQSCPGPRLSAKAFDGDYRYPIVNKFTK